MARSRFFSSFSTACRMRSERFSPSSSTSSMRSSVPSGKRAGVCSWLICRLPMAGRIDDITNCNKPYFCRYHLFTILRYMISSIPSKREMNMTKQLTLGTASILSQGDLIVVRWMGLGSFLVGEQLFGNGRAGANAALRFIRERGLRVVECR